MGALDDFRQANPDYAAVPDVTLAPALYQKFYADRMPESEFNAKIGWQPAPVPPLGGTNIPATGTPTPGAGGGLIAAIREGFGGTPLGLSAADQAKLGPVGDLLQYPAIPLDAIGRTVNAGVYGGAELVGQGLEAAGYPTAAGQARRDLPALANVTMAASATPRVSAPRPLPKLTQTVETFKAEEVPPSLATAAGGLFGKTAVKAAETLPGGGTVIGGPLRKGLQATEAAAERGAGRYGRAASPEAAGEALQSGIESYKGQFSTDAERLYGEVGRHIPGGSPVALSGTTAAVNDIAGRFPSSQTLAEAATPSVVKQIRTALTETNGKLTWDEAQALRSRVGTMLREPQLAPDISRAQLNQLYGALSDDLAGAARRAGPRAEAAWRKATDFYREGSAAIDDHLKSIWGAKSAEAAYGQVLRAAQQSGGADLAKLRTLKEKLAPEQFNEVASTIVRQLGKSAPSATGEIGYSPGRFNTGWNRLSAEAKDILFGNRRGAPASEQRRRDFAPAGIRRSGGQSLRHGAHARRHGRHGRRLRRSGDHGSVPADRPRRRPAADLPDGGANGCPTPDRRPGSAADDRRHRRLDRGRTAARLGQFVTERILSHDETTETSEVRRPWSQGRPTRASHRA